MNNFKLYELTNKYQIIYDDLISDPDITDEILSDCLNDISDDIKDKVRQVGIIIKNIDGFVNAMELEKEKISNRISMAKNRVSNIKKYLLYNMEKCNLTKVSTPEIEVKVKNCPESVIINEPELLHLKYFRTKVITEPDKKMILKDFKEGNKIDGVSIVKNKTLTIN